MMEGEGPSGRILHENDDRDGTNPRIRTTLYPGSYTVEATTYEIGVTGDFRIGVETDELNGRPPITCVKPLPHIQSESGWVVEFELDGTCRSVSRSQDGSTMHITRR